MSTATTRAGSESHLPRVTKVLYGAGDLGFSLTSTILGVLFAIYLTDVVGLSPGLAAAAVFVGRSWDYVNDPLIGHLSDRTRSRWGRRRPFLLFGFLPYALTFAALWWRPRLQGEGSSTALSTARTPGFSPTLCESPGGR